MEVETKLGLLAIFNLHWTVNFFNVEIISIAKPVASQQEMIPTNSFCLVQVVVFACQQLSISQAIDGEAWTEHLLTLHVQTQTLCQHITHDVTRSRVAQVEQRAQNIFSFHLLFRAMFTPCTVHPAFCPLFLNLPLLSPSFTGSGSRLITSRIHWADSRDFRGDGFTDPEPATQHEDDDAAWNRARTWWECP